MKRRMEFGDYVNPMSWIGAPKKTLWTTSEWNMLCSESCLIDFRLNWPRKTPTTVGHYSLEWIWPLPLDIWPQVVATRALIMPSEFYTTASPSLWKRHARWLLFGSKWNFYHCLGILDGCHQCTQEIRLNVEQLQLQWFLSPSPWWLLWMQTFVYIGEYWFNHRLCCI